VASSETSLHPRPDLQNNKDPPGVPAEPPPTIKSVRYLCEEERERERMIDPAQMIFFILPFISLHVICLFCPCQAQGPWRRLISSLTWFDWSHKYWRLPATKVLVRGLIIFRGLKSHEWGQPGPLQSGDKYFPNTVVYQNDHLCLTSLILKYLRTHI
jgi:hypothetical protein